MYCLCATYKEYFYRNGFIKILQTARAITKVTCQKIVKMFRKIFPYYCRPLFAKRNKPEGAIWIV